MPASAAAAVISIDPTATGAARACRLACRWRIFVGHDGFDVFSERMSTSRPRCAKPFSPIGTTSCTRATSKARHSDGDMYPPNVDQFRSFLLSSWSNSAFLVLEEAGRHHRSCGHRSCTRRLVGDLHVLRSDTEQTQHRRARRAGADRALPAATRFRICISATGSETARRCATRPTIAPSNYWSGSAGFASPDYARSFCLSVSLAAECATLL